MKKTLILLLSLIVATSLFSQTNWEQYEKIVDLKSNDPVELSQLITKQYETEREKTEAIYYWVTHNIKYDFRLLKKIKKKGGKPERMTLQAAQERKDNMIKSALKRKKGVCQDYSYVFQSLCKHADIECEFVSGWSKTNPQKRTTIGEKHAWNAVKIDDEWEVVDATYGSGYRNQKGKFEFSFNPHYFFSDKEVFHMNHLPADEKWQLFDTSIKKEEFKKYPIIGSGFVALKAQNLSHKENKIIIKRGEPVTLTFESDEAISKLQVINFKAQKMIPCEVTRDENVNSIILSTDEFRNGSYSFFDSKKLLFVYRVTVK